jgi:hypothetical protein
VQACARRGVLIAAAMVATSAAAQVDPVARDLLEFGYQQPLQGRAPLAAYAFYYGNRPQFGAPDRAARLAVSPTYLDGEITLRGLLGANTDLALGIDGGGFEYDYDEIRAGRWIRGESFVGHGGGVALGVYHLFNPGQRIPLNAILRAGVHYLAYERDRRTSPAFELPQSQALTTLRAGLRFGGVPPRLQPDAAAELSAWYEGQFRSAPGAYGFDDDRRVNRDVHLIWARGLFAYVFPDTGRRVALRIAAGTSVHPDRIGAFRPGGTLTLDAEFPLVLPGYYADEFSAGGFVLAGGEVSFPLDAARRFDAGFGAAVARIRYTPGTEAGRAWNSGVSVQAGYHPASGAWKAALLYGHAFDAIRRGHRGADTLTLALEVDLQRVGRYHQ